MNTKQIAEEAAVRIAKKFVPMTYDFSQRTSDINEITKEIEAVIYRALQSCTCLPMNEQDCPVHSRVARVIEKEGYAHFDNHGETTRPQ